MGKDLKGKEIGAGIYQRKDKKYSARYLSRITGKRVEKYFDKVNEARKWLAEAKYEEEHNTYGVSSKMTVDAWFDFWVKNIVADLAPNTVRNYTERYKTNIQPVVGRLLLSEVKPLHCQKILNDMNEFYAGSTIRQTYITMGTVFKSALMNDLISKHPMDGIRFTKPVKAVNDIKYLTVEEQKKFLEVAKRSHNYYQYALILELGLRTGELVGLTWDSIDWKNRTLTVNKTLEYRHNNGYWRAGPPKTPTSYRTIPLTNRAYDILMDIYSTKDTRKQSDILSQKLDFVDRHTGEKSTLVMKDLVFINYRTGEPAKNSSYDTHLYKLCEEANIRRFCMHCLRHTYATRAVEAGVNFKFLSSLLGHASIKTTLDRYAHTTKDSMLQAVKQFETKMNEIMA
ncbi:MAG: site-specific integrase [Clostridia bacterium]|nr:site-specific integrase [Clostridia bacterium]